MAADTGVVETAAVAAPVPVPSAARGAASVVSADTVRRPRVVEVGDWYNRRLTIHRYTAYAIPPLFVYQYVVGQKLYDGVNGSGEADWVRPAHQTGAALIATAFGVNTVTGLWNLWEGRAATEGRTIRYVHSITMLGALGGFTYAGAKLSQEAKTNAHKRDQHRQVALGSMGLTMASGLLMWLGNK